MSTAARLSGYVAVLALVFGAAWAVGAAAGGPTIPAAAPADPAAPGDPHTHATEPAAIGSAGVVATAAGYTLVPLGTTTFSPGTRAELAFTITGSDGRPVRAFDVEQEWQMHVVVVRRDAAGFLHLHPVLGPDGIWRVPIVLPAPGVYRMYADFVPTAGPALVLGTDLFAPGEFVPIAFPPSRVALVDGYQVRLDGELVPGEQSQLFATVSRAGAGVTDLEPYLGAFGHLVVLRQNDLTYLHVHSSGAAPAPTDRSGPGVAFVADVPTTGGYRLFFEFQHRGAVRTAEFTIATGGGQ